MDVTRFRSFAERYVIERASTFKKETELEDAWSAVERAKTIYKHIDKVAQVEDEQDRAAVGNPTPGPVATGMAGATGTNGPGLARIARHGVKANPTIPAINSQNWTGRPTP